jgi:uncharacterized protein YndB with AHSA1/START domain
MKATARSTRPAAAARFHLVSRWHLAAPIERVWTALTTPRDWPLWWPYVRSVEELAPGDTGGLHARHRIAWSSRLPYGLAFEVETVELRRPHRLRARASGELEGSGLWELQPESDTTRVRYTWDVELATAWMRLVAPLAAPVFRWNHDGVMRSGAQGLARHLGVQLLDVQ